MRNTLSYRHTDIHTEAKRLLQVSVHSSILCRLGENYIIFKTLLLLTGMCVDFVQSVFVNENMIQINIILELLHQLVAWNKQNFVWYFIYSSWMLGPFPFLWGEFCNLCIVGILNSDYVNVCMVCNCQPTWYSLYFFLMQTNEIYLVSGVLSPHVWNTRDTVSDIQRVQCGQNSDTGWNWISGLRERV